MRDSLVAQTDAGSIPGLEKSLGEGNDYPIQGSCLENSTDGILRGGLQLAASQ